MINSGDYRNQIKIYELVPSKNDNGFPTEPAKKLILSPYAKVKTTSGFTLIQNASDFEKAYTNFTIRYPNKLITRDMIIEYNNKTYTIEYLNNIDEANIELEIQAKLVVK